MKFAQRILKRRGLGKLWMGLQWLKLEGAVVWRAMLDRDTPMRARVVALGVILYVVSPIDIIPDFIPVLGWLDDLVVIPIGISIIRMMVPEHVWERAGGVVVRGGRVLRDVTPRKK